VRLFRRLILIAAVLLVARPAAASSITVLVGDKDWFGTNDVGKSPGDLGPFTDGYLNDLRNSEVGVGGQLTDLYSALYPNIPAGCTEATNSGCTPNGSTGFVSFPFTGILQSGTITTLRGGFQCAKWGAPLAYINGETLNFCFDDGATLYGNDPADYRGTALGIFTLTPAMIAAANASGEVRLSFDDSTVTCDSLGNNCKGIDYFAFDYFQLDAEVAPVPEPGTLVLVGLGLAGSVLAARRRLRG
jgi:hypothetical protein